MTPQARCSRHMHITENPPNCLACARARVLSSGRPAYPRWFRPPVAPTTPQVFADNDNPALRASIDARIQAEALLAADPHNVYVRGANGQPPTIEGFLLGEHRAYVTRKLRDIADELCITEAVFPRPINERVAELAALRQAHHRATHRWRGYRGAHRRDRRDVQTTPEHLAAAVAAGARAARIFHRSSLRYPLAPPPCGYIGESEVRLTFYGVEPPAAATFTIAPDDGLVVTLPVVRPGPPGIEYGLDTPVVDPQPSGDGMTGDDTKEMPPC